MHMLVSLLLFAITIENVIATTEGVCKATTKYGNLQGKPMQSYYGKSFCAYLGVPFAMPPNGSLRFLPPKPPEKWEGLKNATTEGNRCLQYSPGGSEDCLYLNIFTHNGHFNQTPVMLFIHGGGFHLGSSSMKTFGPEYFMDKDIVLVTTNYRLGVFGFLSTGDEVVPGNMGLKDQVRAMEWVRENIMFFNGDPEKVTIFGNSAGGASVHLHMQSPLSETLFIRAISQSGTALSSFALTTTNKARADTEKLALALNCTIQNSIAMLSCLQNKSATEVLNAFKQQLISQYGFNKIFRPVVEVPNEHAFIIKSPMNSETSKPWLVGVNANEGLFKIENKRLKQIKNYINSSFKDFGPHEMFITDLYSNINEISESVYNFYFKNNSAENDSITSFERMISDSWFIWPTEQSVQQHSGSLYYYLYNYTCQHSFVEIYDWIRGFGVSHLDELRVLFTQKSSFPPLNTEDLKMSNLMINFWVNFAKEGNPTPNCMNANPPNTELELNSFVWQTANKTNPSYALIEANKLRMKTKMFEERMKFWKELPKQFVK